MKHTQRIHVIIFTTLLIFVSNIAKAQAGNLDLSFSGDGIAGLFFGSGDSKSQSIAIQADGKSVVAGFHKNGSYYDFAIARYKTDGTLDSTFGGDGMVTTDFSGNDDQAFGIAIQPNGKIVVAGYCYHTSYSQKIFAVARYNTNGTLDNTFSGDGRAIADFGSGNQMAYSVAIQSDKKIVLCGNALFNPTQTDYYIAVARFDSVGILDNSFSSNGRATYSLSGSGYDSYAYDMAIQSNQKIIIAGTISTSTVSRMYAMRLNADGNMDNTFGVSGRVTTAINNIGTSGNKMCLQNDQKILVVGGSNNDMAVVRYTANGAIDSTFDNDGHVLIDYGSTSNVGYSIAVAPDGKIVPGGVRNAGANDYDFAIAQLNPNGSYDSLFGTNGKVTLLSTIDDEWITDIAVQNDGKILATGYYGSTSGNFRTVRLISCTTVKTIRNASDCLQYFWDETQQTLTTSGTYYKTHQTAKGCDSIIELHLIIYQAPNVNVTKNGYTLTAVQSGATYQWLDCNMNNDPITGATNQSYTATTNGSYRVEVTKDGCTDYSNCQTISGLGISEFKSNAISISPNPALNYVDIHSEIILNRITVTDINGKELILFSDVNTSDLRIDLSLLDRGIYFVSVTNEEGNIFLKKVMKY